MVVAGGSGGHIFPAVGFCQEFKRAHEGAADIVFVTAAGKKAAEFIPQEFNPVFIKAGSGPLGILRLIFPSFGLMFKIRPDVVLGFGAAMSVPFVMLARLLGKKTIIHEQNVSPGRANRFLSNFVDKIAISFSETQRYLKAHRKKIYLTRYPLRESLKAVDRNDALRFFGLADGLFTILVVGGSQGAHKLNEKFLEAIKQNRSLDRLQIIHVAGSVDSSFVDAAYKRLSVKSKVFAFLPEMHYAYSIADLVIGRSGAGSVIEIMRFGLPSILIPYPYAGGHQTENAKVLAERGASILLAEDKASPEFINGLLDIFKDDHIRRSAMSTIATSLYETSKNLKLSDLVFLQAP